MRDNNSEAAAGAETRAAERNAPFLATCEQIANFTSDDFWYGGRRAFDVEPGGSLTVNVTRLSAEGQKLARWALEAWTNVTGINFEFVEQGSAQINFDDSPGTGTGASTSSWAGKIRVSHINVAPAWYVNYPDATIDSYFFHDEPGALTLYDTGGTDTLDLRTDTSAQRVDLRPEGSSDVYGLVGNLMIAQDTLIEHFIAGSGNDRVFGNAAANRLEGRGGADELRGEGGADELRGEGGADELRGEGSADVLEGGGADRLYGGPGVDVVSYAGSDAAVTVSLATDTASGGHAEGDEISGFENVSEAAAGAEARAAERNEPFLATYEQIANFLSDDFWFGGRRAFDVEPGGSLTVNVTRLADEGQKLARWALEAWTNVTGINFEFVGGRAQINFNDSSGTGTGTSTSSSNGKISVSHINMAPAWYVNYPGATIDSYFFQTYIHEIGHALGLGHAGPYNFIASFGSDNLFLNDSWQVSVESYFSQTQNTYINASYAYVVTPMIADIIAIQNLYGVPADIRGGDTVYGYNSNLDGYLGRFFAEWTSGAYDEPVALTLYDTGGTDVLDLRTDRSAQRVDLRPEGISDVYGLVGNLVIAQDTLIEHFIAGSGNDRVFGNAAANRLEGRGGDDELRGEGGNDVLEGGAGADRLYGGPGVDVVSYAGSAAAVTVSLVTDKAAGGDAAGDEISGFENVEGSRYGDVLTGDSGGNRLFGLEGNDELRGEGGNDMLAGGAGADRLHGGPGVDVVSYAGSDAAVTVSLATDTAAGGHAEGDEISGFENVVGSRYGDRLSGDSGDNRLFGAGGDDTLEGGAGADRLDGGPDLDVVSYAGSDAAVTVSLATDTAAGGHAEGDEISGFENVVGSRYGDRLSGDSGDNRLFGAGGDDTLEGGAGADRLDGGPGLDVVSYAGSDAAVTVSLATDTAAGGHAEGDEISGFENVVGSRYGDRLSGDSGDNRLFGAGGDDTLEGGAGADRLDGGPGLDVVSYAGSDAAVTVSLATDTVSGGHAEGDEISGFENVEGSRYEDRLTGDSGGNRLFGAGGDDTLEGGAGADRLDGGPGLDVVSYAGSDAAVTVSLATGTASGGDAEGDVLSGFENVEGSRYGDRLTGDSGGNRLFGAGGDDTLEGGAGADRLDGGPGLDVVSYAGSDAAVTVSLATGTASGGDAEGDEIVGFESVEGSRYGDRLTGDSGGNRLFGAGGDDTLEGGAGADRLDGGPGLDVVSYAGSDAAVTVSLATGTASGGDAEGDEIVGFESVEGSRYGDRLTGDSGGNRLFGVGGNDTLDGGAGADRLDGGADVDVVSYAGSDAAVTVSLATGTGSGGDAEGDVLVGVENVEGSRYGDLLSGDRGDNRLFGAGGDDVLVGGTGADRLDGGADVDVVSYAGSDAAVTVSLATGTGSGGDAEGDVLVGVENVEGSRYGDLLSGDRGDNRLFGAGGDDVLVGGTGADRLDGGADVDVVSYAGSDGAVTVNLATGTGSGGDAEGDVLSRFENVVGSRYGDRLTGDGAANRLSGGVGNDRLWGAGGDDVLVGGAGADRLDGGAGVDTVSYAGSDGAVTVGLATGTGSGGDAEGDEVAGVENVDGTRYGDRLTGDSGANRLSGGAGNDLLSGGGGGDVLVGGGGADRLDGGPGVDMVSYAGSDRAVAVSLALATASGGDAEGDEISGVENVEGSRYADVLSGDQGVNRLFGGGGDDVLVGGAGADRLDGGSGVDTVSYEGSDETVWVNLTTGAARRGQARGDVLTDIENLAGTRYADRLVGDGGANRLSGGVGNDRLSGLSGNDVLVGGAGADVLAGGPGVDVVSYEGSDETVWVNLTTGAARRGQAQGDVLTDIENLAGTRYADRLVGDGGANRLSGGVGNDRLSGLSGDDVLVGGAGADRLEGGPGVDTASYEGSDGEVWVNLTTGAARRGQARGDVLTDIENLAGTRYADRLVGDGGANRLSGGVGNDRLSGLSGDDVLVGGAGADRLEGGPGVDTASYEGSDGEVWVNLTTGAARRGHAQGDELTDIENLAGTRYADRLVGDGGANRLSGGVGNDRLSGLSGDDVLVGGAGADRLEGGPGVDTVSYEGSDGSVSVNLTTGTALRAHAEGDVLTDIENLAGTRFWDRLVGDGGANRLSGGVGNDRLSGLSGDDVLVGGAGADRLEGGPGVDTVSYEGSDGSVSVNLTTGTALRAHAEGDELTDIENLAGTRFWDRLVGDGGANRLSGGVGNDRLSGLSGDDVLVGGAGADVLEGGPGVDTVSYEGSDGSVSVNLTTGRALRAHAEGDELTDIENLAGTRFWDRLVGDGGANRLSGGVGNDRLSGLSGDDVLVGGAGADVLEGGPGVDTVSYEGSGGSVSVNLSTGTALRAHAEGDVLTDIENLAGTRFWDRLVGDGGANRLSGGVGNDRLSGLSGDDVLVGGAGADVLEGGPGVDTVSYEGSDGSVSVNLTTGTALRAHAEGDELTDIENLAGTRFWDRLVGDGGANRLSGGVGNDRLSGLSGDDVLVGGAGADVLEGGPGVDTVSYEGSDGSVSVNLTTGRALRAHAEGDELTDIENLAGTRFWDRLVGDGGANRLSGGVGNDRLSGLSGDDVLVGGAGADVLEGGPGVDTVSYEGSDGSVSVNLTTGRALRAHAEGDELTDIENLAGTRFWDRLTGDGGANRLSGGVGNDRLTGLGGDDVLVGGAGADVLDGGPGVDAVSYEGSDGSVWVDLTTGTALRAHAEGDVLTDIENLEGTRFWDRLVGDGGANRLSGGVGNDRLSGLSGNDVLVGGAGADVLEGGLGVDTASYEGSDEVVWVNLTTGAARRGHAQGDVLTDIENLAGTRYGDRLVGDGGANRLSGGVGNDRLTGLGGDDVLVGGAGADVLAGGPGVDTVSYEGSDGAVWVDLTTGTALRAHAVGDVLTDIENLAGTRFWDRLVGDGGANRLSGGVGNDRLTGLGGDDVLVGGAGADVLAGGPGVDTVSYEGSDGAVWVDLTTGTALRAHAVGDVLTDIENLEGDAFPGPVDGGRWRQPVVRRRRQ